MGHKVFVSYKYGDTQVKDLGIKETGLFGIEISVTTKARHYVDKLIGILGKENIYKGENDGEDMGSLSDSTISSKLGDKIFDSSVTIVLISKGMKELFTREIDQWIPWEISYSLREQRRRGRKSKTNGILAVVLPDENDSYDYYISYSESLGCDMLNTNFLFKILSNNIFNKKHPTTYVKQGYTIYKKDDSYIQSVRWNEFIANPEAYIEVAFEKSTRIDDYNIFKRIC